MDKPGLLEQANGSTLFLDELLCMPVSLQAKMLRVLQENKVQRLGSNKEISLDVKIVSSLNKSPRDAIAHNELRIDLFYRIGVVMVKIPSLRERLDDLPALVDHFILNLNNSLGTNVHRVDDQIMDHFHNYHWPGNIRELEHLLEGALNIIGYDEDLTMKYFSPVVDTMEQRNLESLPTNISSTPPPPVAAPVLTPEDFMASQAEREKDALKRVLLKTGGNISRSSALLGISRQLFHYKMKKHGLRRDQFSG
jgi:arginine utilization regulatory protein